MPEGTTPSKETSMKEALFYKVLEGNTLQCQLCPHACILSDGQRGNCKVRKNDKGKLYSESYGRVSALHFDPIEKKPLYHFYPGRNILSVGTLGCNLSCKFCQNCEISQSGIDDLPLLPDRSADEIFERAKADPGNIGVAFTYNEPVVWYEFMYDIAVLVKSAGLKNVMVTNGYIKHEPLDRLMEITDAFSVDLKAYSDDFYRKLTLSTITPVKNTLLDISKSGKHLEITNLIIPDYNDDTGIFEDMVRWIAGELGNNTVLHISKYFPMHRMTKPPTPMKTMTALHDIAMKYLNYVYLGNVQYSDEGRSTFCSACKKMVIKRSGYDTNITGLDKAGNCTHCANPITIS